ncbi:hypothetical protein ABZ348_22685 [Streptomyces sp. NPDC005963]|uniref:hypothetical protein n=1 Tax=Streptomyces sp. NPDC005963 TaxID=3156721 RepID=UPI00340D1E97
MHGPGYAPPPPGRPPSPALLNTLRVVFVALSLLSCGMLAWSAMLRIAIIRRRPLDWVLFGISLLLPIIVMGFIVEVSEAGKEPDTTDTKEEEMTGGDVIALLVLLALAIGVPVHYLVIDIRHHQQPAKGWAVAAPPYTSAQPTYGQPPAPGYGYPPVNTPPPGRTPGYGYPPAPPVNTPSMNTPPPSPPPSVPPAPPVNTPPPAAPAADGRRIDQVRAELDELSDYLRREQGR